MIQINQAMFDTKLWESEKLQIFEGPLDNPGITGAAVSGKTATVTFATAGEATDKAIAVIFDEASCGAFHAEATRAAGTVSVSLAALDSIDVSKIHAYLVFVREPVLGTSEKGQVSITAYAKAT
jgi:hypothetical protein